MDPTLKLTKCIYFFGHNKNIKIENTIIKCIEEGAILNKEYYTQDYIPLYHAIIFQCDINIIKILKDAWWDNSYFYEKADNCPYCNTGDTFIIKYYIDVFLNYLYDIKLKHDISVIYSEIELLKEYANLFNVNLLDNFEERHKLIYSHFYKYLEQ